MHLNTMFHKYLWFNFKTGLNYKARRGLTGCFYRVYFGEPISFKIAI